jgi:ABC-type lipoprotein release transport system permease subunit
MMELPSSDRQPSRSTVVRFVDEFTGVLIGKDLKNQVGVLQQSICEVLSGSTTNFKSASRFREALTVLGIDSMGKQTLTTRFMAIGEEVRGPDDSPVGAKN